MQGGNFWEGAAIGLTIGLLNHAGKPLSKAIDKWINPGDKLPDVNKYKNGEKWTSKKGVVYQVNNSHWVKLSGMLIDVNGMKDSAFSGALAHERKLIDYAIYKDDMYTLNSNIIDFEGSIKGILFDLFSTKTLPKFTGLGTFYEASYNLLKGAINQINTNQTHDEKVQANRK